MNTSDDVDKTSPGKCLLDNWVEERATSFLDTEESKAHISKHGHKGIISMDLVSKAQDVTTVKEDFIPPVAPQIRQRGLREELLEKALYKTISQQVDEEFNPGPPPAEFISTTREDFKVPGFQSVPPSPSKEHDYKSDQAISFWSENYQKVQRVTAVRTSDTPFRKNAAFSTPIGQRLDDPVTPENSPDV
ncbi:sperm associated antigen 8 [Anguilla rostrata]|uniref:sperm associated antigen 8 n=1 Tax=Anguilla rostrata TaxID=7938 RepID=UPI0015B0E180|nr:sperm-associated antigen 8 isoform X2 [Anguilla anguilla]